MSRQSGSQSSRQTRFIDKPVCSQSTPACAHVRDREAYFKAWREAKFGGDRKFALPTTPHLLTVCEESDFLNDL